MLNTIIPSYIKTSELLKGMSDKDYKLFHMKKYLPIMNGLSGHAIEFRKRMCMNSLRKYQKKAELKEIMREFIQNFLKTIE